MLVLLTVFASARLRDSRLGRAWIAIREDEVAAAAMGVPLMRTKTWAYATGAFFGGVAGAYYASYNGGAFPDEFFFNISVFILCMVILGGMGNIWGVIFGACFLEYLDREGLANIGAWLNGHFGPAHVDVPLYEFGIFGVILVVVMLFRPEGLIPSSRRAAEFHDGVHDEPLYDVEHDEHCTPTALMPRLRAGCARSSAGSSPSTTWTSRSRGLDRQPDRAERRREDDVLQHAHRRLQADRGPSGLRRRGHDRQAAARVHAARDRAHVPEHPAVQEHDGARERARRHARAAEGQPVRGDRAHAAREAARRGRRASRARELLEFSGLGRVDDEIGKNLSYGDQRRLEVARALATQPKLLLLDEPTAGMNPQETLEFTTSSAGSAPSAG